MEIDLIMRAAVFAGDAHKAQMRKAGTEPYINHPLRVAHLCVQAGLPAHVAAAALLHDVVEDTPVEQAAIVEHFPQRVAQLVHLMTKWWPDDAPLELKADGKVKYYSAIAADPEALALKLLDRTDNLLSMVRILPGYRDWAARYHKKTLKEFESLAVLCQNDFVSQQFADAQKLLAEALERHQGG